MARPVMLGNGSLTVGLNEHGLVHDFYYPYVGLDNLTTSRSAHHSIGVWVEGSFSWVDDGNWQTNIDFEAGALVSNITMKNDGLGIELTLHDFVDNQFNAFCRRVKVKNLFDDTREVRLFMHQVFQISRAGRADTALFVPDDNYILDYKGRCSLLIYGEKTDGTGFDQFAVGSYGIEGKEGTFRDAEDGELSGSTVEHGGVDSVIRFSEQLTFEQSYEVDYWIIASDSQYNAEKIHNIIKKDTLASRLEQNRVYWDEWLSIGANKYHHIERKHLDSLKKSLMIIKVHTDKRGGIIASCDSSIYNYGRDYYSYVWPRDGAYAMWPLIRLGYKDEPRAFFEFCRDILTPEGYLMHKYQPDRAIGSTWHPMLHGKRKELAIQEDETAVVIFMLSEYYRYSQDTDFVRNLYGTFIQPAANFMMNFIDEQTDLPHASYDLWEEKFLTSTYTTAVVYQALLAAAEFAEEFEYPDDAVNWREQAKMIFEASQKLYNQDQKRYIKGFLLDEDRKSSDDTTLDVSSLYGVIMYGLYDDSGPLRATLQSIESILLDKSPSGGSPRYEQDHYFEVDSRFMGNPWFVTTLWLAQFYLRLGQADKTRHYIDWALSKALPSGALSEQIHPVDGTHLSVTPLVWSHAELINTILDLNSTKEE
ncbi:MAG TPA: glycoside hydrolase family 15 protein [Candidatus Saccharimonadales bacterium]|nr:glycoside hydrolase family 15 protein [Candidatus Saccharimonadales bacterium]